MTLSLKRILKHLTISLGVVVSGCYIEGGGCSGPLCLAVSSDTCGLFCNDDAEFVSARCPDADDIQSAATILLNRGRARQRQCVNIAYAAQSPLQWNDILFTVADQHALDMASANFVSQISSNGLGVGSRLEVQGYVSVVAQQSLAFGASDVSQIVGRWFYDAVDCGRLMNASVKDFALACRYDSDSDHGTYWSMVLAAE